MSHSVIIKDAVKKYGDFTALNGVNLEIKPGEFFTLLGPSGCGKTTLLRMIAGFNTVDGGQICFDDKVINNLEAHKRDIGMVFQNYAIFPHLTVAENVAFPLKLTPYKKDEVEKRVAELLELVGLADKAQSYPSQLSGGQKQRVALARALASNPQVLLCDEPTSALDPLTTKSVLELLQAINKKLGVTVIIITHELAVVKAICNRMVVIDGGRFVEQGDAAQIFEHPQSDVARLLLGKEE